MVRLEVWYGLKMYTKDNCFFFLIIDAKIGKIEYFLYLINICKMSRGTPSLTKNLSVGDFDDFEVLDWRFLDSKNWQLWH